MKKIIVGLVFLALSAGPGFCSAISVGNWYDDQWNGTVGTAVTDDTAYTGSLLTVVLDPGTPPWTFSGPAILVVTDLYVDGDQFEVFDNDVEVGTTSTPVNDGTTCGDDPVGCTGSDWSHGTFVFGAGSHSITMTVIAEGTGNTSGNGAFELTSVPEPASFGLMGLGCLGLVLGRRRFRRKGEI
jgi:hypothetical protein